jgi:Transglycosylase SLT domain
MSTPHSRLASFRSYSYYHVLAMCDSTETADALANSTQLNTWEHATQDTREQDPRPGSRDLGPYSPKQLPGAGKYLILINGSTDASFVINRAKWTTATGANAAPGDRGTSIAIEGSIQISEPKGIAFLDQVVKCSVALGVDSSQVVYVIKTFFVGHGFNSENRQEYVEHITDIPPMTFIVYDVTGSFTEAGGSYEMLFVGAGHGATRLPQYSKSVNAMSIYAGTTLQATLKRLQDNINENYEKYYNCVYQQILATGANAQDLANNLRKVNYVITVGEAYSGTNETKYFVTNQSQQYKNTAGCNDPAQITFPMHTSIETAISTIMLMSPQVQADMAVGDTADRAKYEYKIHTALISKQVPGASTGVLDYTVYYRVDRILTPKSIAYDAAFNVLAQDDSQLSSDPRYQQIRNNIIEFDYMYTGKNIDILEFDMKVNMGLAYLQTASIANTFKTQLERAPNSQTQPSTADVNTHAVKFGAIVQTPIFFGSVIRSPNLVNTVNGSHAIQSAYTLSKHSSLEVTDVSMKILGNTSLLGRINLTSSPTYVVNSASSGNRGNRVFSENGTSEPQFAEWSHVPAYVKVRIKMPRENDDFALFTGQTNTGDLGTPDYARDFWFDGYYYVVGVEHVFDGGEFTQTLQMVGIPKRSSFESTKDNASREVNLNNSVASCYDSSIGAKPSVTGAGTSTSSSVIPVVPPTSNTSPTNAADANTINQGTFTLSDVVGWDTASPTVKAAIKDAGERYNIDVVLLARIAAHESSLGKNLSAAPRSSATGLFQHTKETWNTLVKDGKIKGITDVAIQTTVMPGVWLAASPTDPRLNVAKSAQGGAALTQDNMKTSGASQIGDVYLAHFIGSGIAKQIIRADARGGGNELLLTTLGAEQFTKVIKANPSIIKPNMTTGELRTWAATVMAKTVKNGIVIAPQRATPPAAAANAPAGSVQPSANPTNSQRVASGTLAVHQSSEVQNAKPDAKPCGPTAAIHSH